MHFLIIGGTRYLGAAIARELTGHGYGVDVLHRGQTPGELPTSVRHLYGDARDMTFVEACLRNVHYDGVVDTILRVKDLAWCLPLFGRYAGQLVHCGSTGVYAPVTRVPSREDDPTQCPEHFGGFGEKLAQDKAVLAFHEETGFKTCSLRVSNVIGAGDIPLDIWGARNPGYFQRLAEHREIWIPNDGRALVQPVHAKDLAQGFRAALEAPVSSGQIYNLSSDRSLTLTAYARVTAELLGSHSEFHYVAMNYIIATGKANPSGIRFLCEHMCIDSGKARRDLNYEPRIDVHDSLRDSLVWMTERGLLCPSTQNAKTS